MGLRKTPLVVPGLFDHVNNSLELSYGPLRKLTYTVVLRFKLPQPHPLYTM